MLQDNYKYAGMLQEHEEVAKKQQLKIWNGEIIEKKEKPEIENTESEKTIESEISEKSFEISVMLMLFVVGCIIKILKK